MNLEEAATLFREMNVTITFPERSVRLTWTVDLEMGDGTLDPCKFCIVGSGLLQSADKLLAWRRVWRSKKKDTAYAPR